MVAKRKQRTTCAQLGVHKIGGVDYDVRFVPNLGIQFRRMRTSIRNTVSLNDILELKLGQKTFSFESVGGCPAD